MTEKKRIKARKMRKFKENIKTMIYGLKITLLSVLALIVVFVAVVVIAHLTKTNDEIDKLTEAGLYHQVQVEENRNINLVLYGNKGSEHTIVPISGIGIQDFTVFTKNIVTRFKDYASVALVDRAGYGFSDDSKSPQTVEQIISDYRSALNAANIKGPYVLFAHEFGSVYATYWAIQYPDEIEGIIYMDGTAINNDVEIENETVDFVDKIYAGLYKIGFQRLRANSYNNYSKVLSPKEAEYSKALSVHGAKTFAYLSEISLKKENYNTVLNLLKETEVPKMYISASVSFLFEDEVIEYWEYKNEQNKELKLPIIYEFSDDKDKIANDAFNFINRCKEKQLPINEFATTVGSCKLVRIPGDIKIYEQKTKSVASAIRDFISYLEGEDCVKDFYDDSDSIYWGDYPDQFEGVIGGPPETNQ